MKTCIKTLALTACWLVSMAVISPATLAADKEEQGVKAALDASLAKARPGLQAAKVEKTDVAGIFEVALNNGDVIYATADGKHLLFGDLYRLDSSGLVDVRDEKLKPMRTAVLAKVPVSETINFTPVSGPTKALIYVFTDVDCGYCQKLHSHIAEYNALGIEVRYLAYPRAGANSVSAKKLVSAWCADDRQDALTKLKMRQNIPEKSCDNPVAAQYALGTQLGVTGTPAVFMTDGSLIGGYLPPALMAQKLGLDASADNKSGK